MGGGGTNFGYRGQGCSHREGGIWEERKRKNSVIHEGLKWKKSGCRHKCPEVRQWSLKDSIRTVYQGRVNPYEVISWWNQRSDGRKTNHSEAWRALEDSGFYFEWDEKSVESFEQWWVIWLKFWHWHPGICLEKRMRKQGDHGSDKRLMVLVEVKSLGQLLEIFWRESIGFADISGVGVGEREK